MTYIPILKMYLIVIFLFDQQIYIIFEYDGKKPDVQIRSSLTKADDRVKACHAGVIRGHLPLTQRAGRLNQPLILLKELPILKQTCLRRSYPVPSTHAPLLRN